MASPVTCLHPTTRPTVARPLANFPPSIWGDRFASFSFDKSVIEAYAKEVEVMKEEVRGILLDAAVNSTEKMNLINIIQRLGVSYHYENEIKCQLQKLFNCLNLEDDKEYDLYNVSVQFRVFRQHGYKMPCDVFKKFMDSSTGKYKETLASDAKGMLSFFEATNLRLRGEDILDEAASFTTAHLKSMATYLSPPLSKQVNRALLQAFHKRVPRIEARLYISNYEDEISRNELVLKLAKLDFNLLQLMHQQELSHISKWWRDLEFSTNVSYARERVVEVYFWMMAVCSEPQYSFARTILTKIGVLVSIIDDTYDAYGTLEELRLFTDAINRWDISTIDQLPKYMKFIYRTLVNLYDEIDDQISKQGRSYSVYYAKEAMKETIRAHYLEAEWFNSGYTPTFDEYMKNALTTCGYHLLTTLCYVGMVEIADEKAFEWLQSRPKILTASKTICRLEDDIRSHKFEQKRGHVASSLECYMKQYSVSEEEVIHVFRERISNAWKDINEECLQPTTVSMHLVTRILNFTRVIDVVYKHGDGYTNSEHLKDYITAMFIHPVPV